MFSSSVYAILRKQIRSLETGVKSVKINDDQTGIIFTANDGRELLLPVPNLHKHNNKTVLEKFEVIDGKIYFDGKLLISTDSLSSDDISAIKSFLSVYTNTGDGKKFLADDGTYKEVAGGGSGSSNSSDISYENSNYPSWTNVKKALDGIMAKIDYIKPEITSFTSTAQAVYEIGQKVSNIVFNWTTNKNVTTQTLTDCTINADSRTATYTKEISSNKTFTLTVGDGQNTASKSVSIAFRNKIYYGSSVIPSSFNSAFILGLSKNQFATGKNGNFSITVGSNEYGFIAFPSSFGTLTSVKIGGFDTDVTSCGNISFTNSSGGVVTYSIYRTGRHSLGAITMVIS